MFKLAVILMAAVVVVLAGCQPAAPGQPPAKAPATVSPGAAGAGLAPARSQWDTVLAAAKKEGKVTVVTFIGPETRVALGEAFKAKYGIELEFMVGRAAETVPKVEAERRAGLYLADVAIDGSSTMIQLNSKGMLEPIESSLILPEVKDPKMWFRDEIFYYNANRTGIGFLSQYNSCLLRNTDMVKEGEISSYRDLLQPKWKDKVVMDDPSVGGSGAMFMATLAYGVWNVEDAGRWLRQMLEEQKMILLRDPKLQVEWVARGKYPVTMAVWTDQLVKFLNMGSPIAQQKVAEGGFITSSNGGIGLYNRAAHPNAATVFVNWLLSQEGQNVFASSFGGPSRRKDVKTEGAYAALMPLPGDRAYEERSEEQITNKVELTKKSAQIIAQSKK